MNLFFFPYLYHSLTLITNVLTSLSSVSSSEMAWMIMLSTRLMLNLTLAREYECDNPSCALCKSTSSSCEMKRVRWARTPRKSSEIYSPGRGEEESS